MAQTDEGILKFSDLERLYLEEFGAEGKEYSHPKPEVTTVERAATINRPIAEVYSYWRDFKNLPLFMKHLVSVTPVDRTRSHWVAKAPRGTVEWDAEIVEDKPNELISWRSLEGASVDNIGEVRFNTSPRGTEVRIRIKYDPPGGKLGAAVATLFSEEPHSQVRDDLWRFKAILEAGEIPTIDGQSHGS